MRNFLVAAAAACSTIALLATPSFSASTGPVDSSVIAAMSDADVQVLMQDCLAAGLVNADQLKQLSDEDLNKALAGCATSLQTAAATPPAAPAAAPAYVAPRRVYNPVVVERAPVVVQRSSPRVVREFVAVQQDGGGFSGGGGGGLGGLGEVIGGILGGGGGGGGIGGGGNGAGEAIPPPPPVDPLDARIESLRTGIQEGIDTSALTPAEAASLGARLAAIQASRANLGDTPANRRQIQQQLDAAIAQFNNQVRNNNGIPNSDLFRSARRQTPAAGGDPLRSRFAALRAKLAGNSADAGTGTFADNRFARLRARLASKNADPSSFGKSRFAALRARLAARNTGSDKPFTNSRFDRLKARLAAREAGRKVADKMYRGPGNKLDPSKIRCFRAPCPGTATSNESSGRRFVKQRLERLRAVRHAVQPTTRRHIVARRFDKPVANASVQRKPAANQLRHSLKRLVQRHRDNRS